MNLVRVSSNFLRPKKQCTHVPVAGLNVLIPERRMPFMEKLIYGILYAGAMISYPLWVILNLRHLQKQGN